MFLFFRKYGVEMSRAESPVSSYTCADLAALNWRRRVVPFSIPIPYLYYSAVTLVSSWQVSSNFQRYKHPERGPRMRLGRKKMQFSAYKPRVSETVHDRTIVTMTD